MAGVVSSVLGSLRVILSLLLFGGRSSDDVSRNGLLSSKNGLLACRNGLLASINGFLVSMIDGF